MDRTERLYRINELLQSKRSVSRYEFMEDLEISLPTFKRDLEYLRDRLHAPIIYDAELKGYRFDIPTDKNHSFQLPGLWFNDSEVYALLIMEYLLENLNPGMLTPHIAPLRAQISCLLDKGEHSIDDVRDKIKLLPVAAREYKLQAYQIICHGLLSGRRLKIMQYSRQRDEYSEREISPQRLVHYRDNWYLDAWCHLRKDLRTFAVDTIKEAQLTEKNIKKVSKRELDEVLKAGYGIFSGKQTNTAQLRFTPERARWVSRETWHPDQKALFNDDGSYTLILPYSNTHELIMDILKYGPDVIVESPKELKHAVKQRLSIALKHYN